MVRLLVVILVLTCAGFASAQIAWYKFTTSYPWNYLTSDVPATELAYEWTNSGQTTQRHAVGGTFYYVQRVTGSNETPGPTWESPFNVLSNTTQELQWEVDEMVPAGKFFQVKVNLLVDEGCQTWYEGPPGLDEDDGLPANSQARSILWKTLAGSSPYFHIYRNWP